jgi:hypothetical protein
MAPYGARESQSANRLKTIDFIALLRDIFMELPVMLVLLDELNLGSH